MLVRKGGTKNDGPEHPFSGERNILTQISSDALRFGSLSRQLVMLHWTFPTDYVRILQNRQLKTAMRLKGSIEKESAQQKRFRPLATRDTYLLRRSAQIQHQSCARTRETAIPDSVSQVYQNVCTPRHGRHGTYQVPCISRNGLAAAF